VTENVHVLCCVPVELRSSVGDAEDVSLPVRSPWLKLCEAELEAAPLTEAESDRDMDCDGVIENDEVVERDSEAEGENVIDEVCDASRVSVLGVLEMLLLPASDDEDESDTVKSSVLV
jgi:hypothetical protein